MGRNGICLPLANRNSFLLEDVSAGRKEIVVVRAAAKAGMYVNDWYRPSSSKLSSVETSLKAFCCTAFVYCHERSERLFETYSG